MLELVEVVKSIAEKLCATGDTILEMVSKNDNDLGQDFDHHDLHDQCL